MSLLQAVLCGLIYYLGNSPFPFGDAGYYIVYRPIFAGFLVGLVLGDPVMGTVLGATINLMYIGQISAGGAIPSDMCLAGVLGTALGITGGLSTEAALAVAVPLGLLGTLLFYGRMTLDCIWLHLAEKKVEKGGNWENLDLRFAYASAYAVLHGSNPLYISMLFWGAVYRRSY